MPRSKSGDRRTIRKEFQNYSAVSLAMHGLWAQVRNEFYKFHLQPLHVSTLIVHPHEVPYIHDALTHKLQGVTPCNLCQTF